MAGYVLAVSPPDSQQTGQELTDLGPVPGVSGAGRGFWAGHASQALPVPHFLPSHLKASPSFRASLNS